MKKFLSILVLGLLVVSCASTSNTDVANANLDMSSFDRVYFALGKSDLSDKSKKTLDLQAKALKSNDSVKVVLNGYSDVTGTPEFNKELSKQRALSVKEYLVNKGVNESNLDVEFFGSDSPIKNKDGKVINEENRVVITTLK